MSYKHHTQQKRRKWAEQGATFSARSVATLVCLEGDAAALAAIRSLAKELRRFSEIQFTCAEVEVLKDVLAVFQTEMARGGFEGEVKLAVSLLLEVVFADNSRPLHRGVLTALKKLNTAEQQALVASALQERIAREAQEYLDGHGDATPAHSTSQQPAPAQADTDGPLPQPPARSQGGVKVVLGQTLASLLWLPAFQDWVRPVAIKAVQAVAVSTHQVLLNADAQQHVAPSLMNEIQDAISSLYYIIQRHGNEMAGQAEGCAALLAASRAMIYALQGHVLVREAMASAAVVVWVTALCPSIPPQHVAAQFATGLFLNPSQQGAGFTITPEPRPTASAATQQAAGEIPSAHASLVSPGTAVTDASAQRTSDVGATVSSVSNGAVGAVGTVESALRAQGSSLAAQVAQFSPVGKVCSLKGLVTAIAPSAMGWPLKVTHGGAEVTPSVPTPRMEASAAISAGAALALGTADGSGKAGASEALHATPFTFLVSGALMYGCQQVLAAPDGHFKFHAACVANTCMAQLLELWRSHITERATQARAVRPPSLSRDTVTAILDMLWVNLDEPLAQTLRQLQGIFDMLLEVMSLQHMCMAALGAEASRTPTHAVGAPGPLSEDSLLMQVARRLVAVSPMRKGRYTRLTSMVSHVGAQRLLALHPPLITEALNVLQEDMVNSSASNFLKVLLENLRKECALNPVFAGASEGSAPAAQGLAPQSGAAAGEAEGRQAWLSWWLPELLEAMTSGNERLRYHVSLHALPVVLTLEPFTFITLILHILPVPPSEDTGRGPADMQHPPAAGRGACAPGGHQFVAAFVSLLRAARHLQMITDLDSLTGQGEALGVDVEKVLLEAVVHKSESVRVDCLELCALNPKTSEPPGQLELKVVARWLSRCLRSTSQGQRNRCIALINKLMGRIQTAVHACHNRAVAQSSGATSGRFVGADKGRGGPAVLGVRRQDSATGSGQAGDDAEGAGDPITEACRKDAAALANLQRFCQWVSRTMLGYLYPGAPFERKYLAMEVLNAMLAVWPVTAGPFGGQRLAQGTHQAFAPYCSTFFSPHVIQLLLANAIDSWSKLRQSATVALMHLPAPWPGVASGPALMPLLTWAYQLLCSPRVKEADAGARMLKLVFAKYTCELGWHIVLGSTITVDDRSGSGEAGGVRAVAVRSGGKAGPTPALFDATHAFLTSLLDLVQAQCQLASQGEAGLLAACRTSFAHGPLLLLRYVTEEIAWSPLAACLPTAAIALRRLVARTLTLIEQLTALAVGPLAAPVSGVGAEDVDAGDMDGMGGDGDEDGDGAEGMVGDAGPDAQVIVTGCWLSVKEAALVVGTLAHCLPLDEAGEAVGHHTDTEGQEVAGTDTQVSSVALPDKDGAVGGGGGGSLLDASQLSRMGRLLVLDVLLVAKHNGTCDKAAMGLTTLTGKLLRSTNPSMSQQPQALLAECMKKLVSPGQGLDDIVRRSAGIPLAIGALLRAEPANTPKVMLARTMAQVLAVAQYGAPAVWTVPAHITGVQGLGLTTTQGGAQPVARDSHKGQADATGERNAGTAASHGAIEGKLEGGSGAGVPASQRWPMAAAAEPWPRVHAFNVLRHLVSDSQLAVDTSGYHAAAVQACISSVGDPAWEVRNAATLCFTALVVRVLGFKNVGKWEKPRRAITGAEFFSRFPGLHKFLLSQLSQAVQQLESDAASCATHSVSPCLHPSLFPILILLSRLRPGPPLETKGAACSPALSPALFAPLVRRCASARQYAVRQLAALAVSPLVPAEQVMSGLLALLPRLPASNHPAACLARQQCAATATTSTDAVSWPEAHSAGPTAPVQLTTNALQGLLMQLEALLRHNVMPGLVDQVLLLVDPHLVALLTAWHPAHATSPVPAACRMVLLRCCHAALPLMQPRHCASHTTLLQSVMHYCQATVEAGQAGFGQQQSHPAPGLHGPSMVDFCDPMHAAMLKEAAKLWVGVATLCTVCAQPAVITQGATPTAMSARVIGRAAAEAAAAAKVSGGPAAGKVKEDITLLGDALKLRLQFCLASPSVDVRAAGAKAAAEMLATWRDRLFPNSSGSAISGLKPTGGRCSVAAAQADEERWSLILKSAAKAPLNLAVVKSLGDLSWVHLQTEPVYKVRKRLLRALHAAHAITTCSRIGGPASGKQGAGCAEADASERGSMAQVMALLASACGVEERAEALRWLGQRLHMHAVRRQISAATVVDGSGDQSLASALNAFCTELEVSSQPTQLDDVRLAAADALASSQLLNLDPCGVQAHAQAHAHDSTPPEHSLSHAALRCWLVALTLSEDEDDRVRTVATEIMQASSASSRQLHTEGVQRAAIALLPTRFTGSPHLPRALCDLIVRPYDQVLPEVIQFMSQAAAAPSVNHHETPSLSAAAAAASDQGVAGQVGGGAVGRIFDDDVDNQHEEPLFLAQLAAQQLRRECELATIGSTPAGNSVLLHREQEVGGPKSDLPAAAADASLLKRVCLGPVSSAVGDLQRVAAVLPQQAAAPEATTRGGGIGSDDLRQVIEEPTVLPYLYSRLLLIWATAPLFPGEQEVHTSGQDTPAQQQEWTALQDGMVQAVRRLCSGRAGPLAMVAGPVLVWSEGLAGAASPAALNWHDLGPLFLCQDCSDCINTA